jgi:uncharacterized protein YhaN
VRIARLDLARYGRFSDYVIDFGAAPSDGSDFHIVYGLNEAGKSTAAAAILDLLFGIEKQSAYGAAEVRTNWHAYSAMRIGARLELAGGALEVARIKREKHSLVDADNRPLDEALIKAELGGVDRAAFRMMFSLDDESLEKGGEAILESRGDLGQLLFSASAGLAEMSGRLDGLREAADRFFRPRAKASELAEKKRALEALKEERDKADTLASAYAELIRRRDEAKAAYESAARALSERRSRAETIQRLLAGLPHLAALSDAEGRLAPLAKLPAPPDGWRERLADLQTEAIRLTAQRENAETTIRALEEELGRIGEDPAALEVAARVDGWRELRSRYDSAKDIPVRRAELDGRRNTVAETLGRLGRAGETEPETLLLSVRTVGALEDLIAERSGVLTKLEGARATLDEASRAETQALEEAPQRDGGGAAFEVLKARLQTARRDEATSRLRTLREEMQRQGRKFADVLTALAPWRGDPEALALVSVPGEAEIAALRQRRSQTNAGRQSAVDRLADKMGEAERLRAEAAAAARAVELCGDDVAANLRTEREAAWSAHRVALNASSADAFEVSMRRDDEAGAIRLANARELAARREQAVKLAGLEAECGRAAADLDAAEKSLHALDHEITALMPAPPPRGRDPLSFLDAWRARREEAMAIIAMHRESKEAARRANDGALRACRALSDALRAVGAQHAAEGALEALIEDAEAAIAEYEKVESLRQKARDRRVDVVRAEGRLKGALEEDARWRGAWRVACAGSWLSDAEPEPPLSAVRQALKALEDLRAALRDCAELNHRIAAMEHDKRLFAANVGEIGQALGLDERDDAGRLADVIEARVARAREDERRRQDKTNALAAARKTLGVIVEAVAVNARFGSAMADFFGVGSLAEVAARLEDCRRRDALGSDIAREAGAILALNIANAFDAARTALEMADRTALDEELSALKTREADDEAASREYFAAYREALRRLEAVGGDDAVARIEEKRRTILEEVKDGARRYLTLRAGLTAADEALRLYRERHRGAMMERASKAFSEISRGAYRGLTAQPNGRSETLIALGADGGSKAAEQLSKGARFQLYLALRVAGYHELAKARTPAPFIADDIMETFDHFRAEEALRLFADMGRVGQVIYLTHHLHLAEIARRICAEARVHELQM